MPAEFDRHSADYETAVERAVAFAGQPHDVYIEAKARKLLDLARRRLGAEQVAALDVGCGPGLVALHLSGRVSALHGVDVSEAMVERARAAVPEAEFRVSEPGRLPYEDGGSTSRTPCACSTTWSEPSGARCSRRCDG